MTLTLGHVTTVTATGDRVRVVCCCGWASSELTPRLGRWPDQPDTPPWQLLATAHHLAKLHRGRLPGTASLPAQRAAPPATPRVENPDTPTHVTGPNVVARNAYGPVFSDPR